MHAKQPKTTLAQRRATLKYCSKPETKAKKSIAEKNKYEMNEEFRLKKKQYSKNYYLAKKARENILTQ
jgi:hypothetical protein